ADAGPAEAVPALAGGEGVGPAEPGGQEGDQPVDGVPRLVLGVAPVQHALEALPARPVRPGGCLVREDGGEEGVPLAVDLVVDPLDLFGDGSLLGGAGTAGVARQQQGGTMAVGHGVTSFTGSLWTGRPGGTSPGPAAFMLYPLWRAVSRSA